MQLRFEIVGAELLKTAGETFLGISSSLGGVLQQSFLQEGVASQQGIAAIASPVAMEWATKRDAGGVSRTSMSELKLELEKVPVSSGVTRNKLAHNRWNASQGVERTKSEFFKGPVLQPFFPHSSLLFPPQALSPLHLSL